MAISTGEIINVLDRWEKRVSVVEDYMLKASDPQERDYFAIEKTVLLECIGELEEVIAASMRYGISF